MGDYKEGKMHMKQKVRVLISGILVIFSSLVADDQPPVPEHQVPEQQAPGQQQSTDLSAASTGSAAAPVAQSADVEQQWKPSAYTFDVQGDDARGDWYKKRKILQQARSVHERMHQVVKVLDELEKTLIEKYEPALQRLKKSVDDFGFSFNSVQEVAQGIDTAIQKYTEAEGARNEVDRQKLIDLQDSKKLVDEFKDEFKYLLDLADSLAQSLGQLKSQVGNANEYEQKAWKIYETIEEVFNDSTAGRLLSEMQASLENVEMIEAYIKNDLDKHCQDVITRFDGQTTKVESLMNALTQRGVLFKEKSVTDMVSTSTEQTNVGEEKKAAPLTWWRRIIGFITGIWKWFTGLFR